jgi:hypothetical protein
VWLDRRKKLEDQEKEMSFTEGVEGEKRKMKMKNVRYSKQHTGKVTKPRR